MTGVFSMFVPPRSGAYVPGTVSGPITIGAGSALPCETTLTCGPVISVVDRLDVVLVVSPLESG